MFSKSDKKKEEKEKTVSSETNQKADATATEASPETSEQPNAETSETSERPNDQTSERPNDQTSETSKHPNTQTPEQPNAQTSETSEQPNAPTSKEPDWKTLYALTLADFDNYKKRAARDREDVYRYAESDILKDVLPALDNLQLALASAKDKAEDPFVKGVQLVYETLLKSLKEHGAEPFDSVGKELDTEKMEAIATLPDEKVEEGKVSIESKKGWMLKDKVLRAAQVVVSSGKPG